MLDAAAAENEIAQQIEIKERRQLVDNLLEEEFGSVHMVTWHEPTFTDGDDTEVTTPRHVQEATIDSLREYF